MALRQVAERTFALKGWFSPKLTPEGWFDFNDSDGGSIPIRAIFVAQATTGDATAHLTSTIVAPATIQAGDLLLLFVHEVGTGHTFTADNGFGTPTDAVGQTSCNIAFWKKTATGAEAGATISVVSSANFRRTLQLIVLRGVGTGATLTVDAFDSALSGANSSVVVAPSVTMGLDYDFVVTFHATATSTSRTWSSPWRSQNALAQAGPTSDTGANASGSASAIFYDPDWGQAGPTGTLSATNSGGSNIWGAYTIAVTAVPITTTNKSDTDTGTGTETSSLAVAESANETGAGAETSTLAVAESANETGAGAETTSLAVAESANETGAGAETSSLAVAESDSETGSGADTSALTTSISSSETGAGAETSTLAVAESANETGAGVETTSLSATASSSDTGSGADTSSLAVSESDSETGSSTETGTLTSVTLSSSESPTGVETSSLAVSLTGSDVGSGDETSGFTKADQDTGAFAETSTLAVALSSSESPAGVETSSLAVSLTGTDTGSGDELSGFTKSADDTGAFVETSSLAVSLSGTETGTGAETTSLAVSGVSSTDPGSSADTSSLTATISGADTGSGADTAGAPAASVAATDTGTGAETTVGPNTAYSVAETGTATEDASLGAAVASDDDGSATEAFGVTSVTMSDTDVGGELGTGTPPDLIQWARGDGYDVTDPGSAWFPPLLNDPPTQGDTLIGLMVADQPVTVPPNAGTGNDFVLIDRRSGDGLWTYVWSRRVGPADDPQLQFFTPGLGNIAFLVFEVDGIWDVVSTAAAALGTPGTTQLVLNPLAVHAESFMLALVGTREPAPGLGPLGGIESWTPPYDGTVGIATLAAIANYTDVAHTVVASGACRTVDNAATVNATFSLLDGGGGPGAGNTDLIGWQIALVRPADTVLVVYTDDVEDGTFDETNRIFFRGLSHLELCFSEPFTSWSASAPTTAWCGGECGGIGVVSLWSAKIKECGVC